MIFMFISQRLLLLCTIGSIYLISLNQLILHWAAFSNEPIISFFACLIGLFINACLLMRMLHSFVSLKLRSPSSVPLKIPMESCPLHVVRLVQYAFLKETKETERKKKNISVLLKKMCEFKGENLRKQVCCSCIKHECVYLSCNCNSHVTQSSFRVSQIDIYLILNSTFNF